MSQIPPQAPPHGTPGAGLRPHRGVMLLVFGILSFVICFIFGICAWVMGNADLREMDAGRMDPEGRGLTTAGKILGMISVILTCVVLGIYLVLFVLIGIGAAAGAAGGP
jgi:hypothetical protein